MSVSLRRATPADAPFLHALVTGEETQPFLGRTAGETLDDVLVDVERSAADPEAFGWFVVEVDGEPAGSLSFRRVNERSRIAEANRFALDPRFRGRGLGEAAARMFQRYLIEELGFHRIEIQVYGFNERAIAHAERVGYVREGVKRKAYLRHGEWQDAVLFSLLADELPR